MIEKFIVPHGPADRSGGGGADRPEQKQKQRARRRPLDWAVAMATKSGRRQLRQERSEEQRAKEAREHLSEPEKLRKRLKEFDEALYYVAPQDRPTAALAQLIYKKVRKLKLPKTGDEKVKFEEVLADEARRYLFTGLMPRGDELVDGLKPETRAKKSSKELQRMREINEKTVARHLRTYLMWRWAEQEWQRDWHDWLRQQEQKKEMPPAPPPASFPKWQDELNHWVAMRIQQKQQGMKKEPPRPPAPPEQSFVASVAKRLGEDHLQWHVEPLKPEIAS